MIAHTIIDVRAIECDLVQAPWAFQSSQAETIERNWQRRVLATPELFNGRVLLLHEGGVAHEPDGLAVFRGAFLETDFKTFLAWRDLGFPPGDVRNCFAMAALESADGAFILGEMNTHTAPAGQIYFPSGTPDRKDVIGHKVDLEASARRELFEETGLDCGSLAFQSGFTLVTNAARVCCMKRVRSSEPAETLVARIHDWLARDPKPELARMHVVRNAGDITPAMPDFVAAYMRREFWIR